MCIRYYLLIVLTAALGGCQTVWVHPTKNEAQFNQDKYRCMTETDARYPVVMSTYYLKNGKSYTLDDNATSRAVAFDACIRGEGWSLQKKAN